MLIKSFTILKNDLINEASESEEGQDWMVRAILGATKKDEFMPTGFNDCWDIVKEQVDRKIHGNRKS